MRMRFSYLAATGVVAAMLGAPAAAADDTNPTCTSVGQDTECSTPGNVEITDSPPVIDEPIPYWDEFLGIPL